MDFSSNAERNNEVFLLNVHAIMNYMMGHYSTFASFTLNSTLAIK
jgi:hypothetical protein